MKNQEITKQHFTVCNNELYVGKYSISAIDNLLGGTPYYAYDKQLIRNKIKLLKDHLPSRILLHYAIKANPYQPLVNLLAEQVDGFDVASKKELLQALQTSIPAKNIGFAGPGKSNEDLSSAIIAGATIHIESLNELNKAISLGKSLTTKPNIAIRVNPRFELKASGMKMSGGSKPFGIDEELLEEILTTLDYQTINFKGFHIFCGSQNLHEEALKECHEKTFALAIKLIELTPHPVSFINIGGGLGVPYFRNDKALEITEITNNLSQLLKKYQKQLTNVEIIMELGRYLVAEAGIYICKVIDKKLSRGTLYLVCDGGLHHHLANSGNFGQVIRKNYPTAIANKINLPSDKVEMVNIVGPLCTPLDIIAEKIELPITKIGDYVVIYQSGAYGATASPKDFLSQPYVQEVLL